MRHRFFSRQTGLLCSLVCLFYCLSALSSSAYAQQETAATITGRVIDATGAAIAGAIVVVTNQENGAVRRIQTNTEGSYIATPLIPGGYNLTIEQNGFKKYV